MRFEDYLRKDTEDFIATFLGALDNWELCDQENAQVKPKILAHFVNNTVKVDKSRASRLLLYLDREQMFIVDRAPHFSAVKH